jgi:hypothetical protein
MIKVYIEFSLKKISNFWFDTITLKRQKRFSLGFDRMDKKKVLQIGYSP